MKFDLYCTKPIFKDDQVVDVEVGKLVYDNMTSELLDVDGSPIVVEKQNRDNVHRCKQNAFATSEQTPAKKSSNVRVLKIQLGLSCNYACEYCSQRFVPNAPETNSKYVDKFMSNLDLWLTNIPEEIEFWGGEPLVYWKTLEPLAIRLREKFPNAKFLMITNGSILTDEIIDWVERMDINVGVSHDGPGQFVRGPDPLDDPEQRAIILKLFEKRKGRTSFNSMIHRLNLDRGKIQDYFQQLLGHDQFTIGEGSFVDSYDEGGKANSLQSVDEHLHFRRLTMHQIREGKNHHFQVVRDRINQWVKSIQENRNALTLGQKCGMDREDTIAVDLRGNVVTCQNVSAVSTAPNNRPHLIGHVLQLDKVRLRTATHWSFRDECNNCPVLQVCKGSCMFLQDELFKISCDSAYSDHIPFFASSIEMLTGWLPFRIEAHGYNLPADRVDLWGSNKQITAVPERTI